jgi:hypothetical protein
MALLGDPIWPDVEYKEDKYGTWPVDWEAENRWLDDQLASQPAGLVGYILSFQVADGYAHYKVGSLNPLTLHWIAYGDRYQIAPAHVRGLSIQDVRTHAEAERSWKALATRNRS